MRLTLIIAVMTVAGCAPLTIYHKAGVPVARMERDTQQCAVSALRDVPVSTQIRREPAQYIPGHRICNSAGKCRTTRGYYIPGEIYTVDVNERLRARQQDFCMADRGYAPVSIPPCPDSVARAAPAARTDVLPQLNPRSCAIRNRNGTYQIVTQG